MDSDSNNDKSRLRTDASESNAGQDSEPSSDPSVTDDEGRNEIGQEVVASNGDAGLSGPEGAKEKRNDAAPSNVGVPDTSEATEGEALTASSMATGDGRNEDEGETSASGVDDDLLEAGFRDNDAPNSKSDGASAVPDKEQSSAFRAAGERASDRAEETGPTSNGQDGRLDAEIGGHVQRRLRDAMDDNLSFDDVGEGRFKHRGDDGADGRGGGASTATTDGSSGDGDSEGRTSRWRFGWIALSRGAWILLLSFSWMLSSGGFYLLVSGWPVDRPVIMENLPIIDQLGYRLTVEDVNRLKNVPVDERIVKAIQTPGAGHDLTIYESDEEVFKERLIAALDTAQGDGVVRWIPGLAEALSGLSPGTTRDVENAQHRAAQAALSRLCRTLGLSSDDYDSACLVSAVDVASLQGRGDAIAGFDRLRFQAILVALATGQVAWSDFGLFGRILFAMFCAAIAAVLIGYMSWELGRPRANRAQTVLAFLLLLLGMFFSAMSGFVVIWTMLNDQQMVGTRTALMSSQFISSSDGMKQFYKPKFDALKADYVRQDQLQRDLNDLQKVLLETPKKLREPKNLYDKLNCLLRRIDTGKRTAKWNKDSVLYCYGNYQDKLSAEILGHGKVPGFGPEAIRSVRDVAADIYQQVREICRDQRAYALPLNDIPIDCEGPEGTPYWVESEDAYAYKACVRPREIKDGVPVCWDSPNTSWVSGTFRKELNLESLRPYIDFVAQEAATALASIDRKQAQFHAYPRDARAWIEDFEEQFSSHYQAIKQSELDWPAKFTKLAALSERLALALGGNGIHTYAVEIPEPKLLHTVVRAHFFARLPWLQAYRIEDRFRDVSVLHVPEGSNAAQLLAKIEESDDTVATSRQAVVDALENSMQRRLDPFVRVQLLGIAGCGIECESRLKLLEREEPELAGKLRSLPVELLASEDVTTIESELFAVNNEGFDTRERDLVEGFVRPLTGSFNTEGMALVLAMVADLLSVMLGVYFGLRVDSRDRARKFWNAIRRRWPKTEEHKQWKLEAKRHEAQRVDSEREIVARQRWRDVMRQWEANFADNLLDFIKVKRERWVEDVESRACVLMQRVDNAIQQDVVLMSTGISGKNIDALADSALRIGEMYKDISSNSIEVQESFLREVENLHKTVVEIEAIRHQYEEYQVQMQLLVENLAAARTRTELAATLTKIEALEQASADVKDEVSRYVDQSLQNFRSVLHNIEHIDRMDVYHRLPQEERGRYQHLKREMERATSTVNGLIDDFLDGGRGKRGGGGSH